MAILPFLSESDRPNTGLDAYRLNTPSLANSAQAPLGFVQDNTPAAQVQYKQPPATPFQKNSQAGYYGLAAAGQAPITPNAGEAAVGVLGSGLQGAAMGGSVGGPVGAVVGGGVGLVMGGLNAYMGLQSARRARDKEEALRQDAIRMQRDETARDEKWRQINRLDSLEEARYQRKKYAMQSAYEVSQNQGKAMMSVIQGNQQLKDHFAKFGW